MLFFLSKSYFVNKQGLFLFVCSCFCHYNHIARTQRERERADYNQNQRDIENVYNVILSHHQSNKNQRKQKGNKTVNCHIQQKREGLGAWDAKHTGMKSNAIVDKVWLLHLITSVNDDISLSLASQSTCQPDGNKQTESDVTSTDTTKIVIITAASEVC